MAKCSRKSCPNETQGYKMCLSCRLYIRAKMRKRYDRYHRADDKQTARRSAKKEWTQEKWEAFVKDGGLNGL